MKEMCDCSQVGARENRWCKLLAKADRNSGSLIHFWYKLDWLREEVSKRSAYLGKLRRTEESQHLLDLIKMTSDEDDLFVPYAKAAMADVFDALQKYAPKHEKAYHWQEGVPTIEFDDTTTPAVVFYKNDYVRYNGLLYIALDDGDSDDFAGKLMPTQDYRESIHYGVLYCCHESNINMVEPLDVAIFEALTTRIIYKWLMDAYPEEAVRYLNEYNENLGKIRTRCSFLNGSHIVKRIPRQY